MSMEQARTDSLALSVRIVDSVAGGTTSRDENVAKLTASFMDIYKLGAADQHNAMFQFKSLAGNPDVAKMLKSKTLWSIVMTSVATIAPKVGLHFGWLNPDTASDRMVEIVAEVFQVAGLLGAAWGRVVAKEKLTQ